MIVIVVVMNIKEPFVDAQLLWWKAS